MDIGLILGQVFTPDVIVSIFTAILGFVLTALVGAGVGLIRAHTTAEQQRVLENIAQMAVNAAEQGALAGFVQDKKASALNAASAALTDHGVRVSPAALDAAIEAAVLQGFNHPYYFPAKTAPSDTVDVQPEVSGA